jgi:hypothetical protein
MFGFAFREARRNLAEYNKEKRMPPSPEIPTTEHYQFETVFRHATAAMFDRIGKAASHGRYGEDEELAKEMFVPADPRKRDEMYEAYGDQKQDALVAYLQLTRYDRSLGYDPAVSLILLPPKALLEVASPVREQFLDDYAGARVVDEERLIVGAVNRWTLAVVQGDLRGGQKRPAGRPSHLHHMAIITPEGYAGMGGSIDRQTPPKEQCTALDAIVEGEPATAFGSYVRGGPQSHRGHKVRPGERDPVIDGEHGPARIILRSKRPETQFHRRPMTTVERLMYWAGMNS